MSFKWSPAIIFLIVALFHAGGDIPRALDLCFRAGEDPSYANNTLVYDMLNTIAQVCCCLLYPKYVSDTQVVGLKM